MNLFHELEKRIDEKLRGLFRGETASQQSREIVEIQRFLLDRIGERVQVLPRARRVFPFNEVAVRIPVPNPDQHAGLEMVFVADSAFEHDVREYLRREGVEFPADLRVDVTLYDTDQVADPSLICRKREKAVATDFLPPPVRISFGGESIEIAKARIHFGRLPEVLDDRRRPVRRNDIVIDGSTVSRAHAHIEWDASSGEYRVFDDGSSYGTSVLHEGKMIDVPPGSGRGVRLQPGDEIYLGQARVLVEAV